MNKQLFSTLLATLFMAGFVSAQTQTSTTAAPAPTATCCKETAKKDCPKPGMTCTVKNDHDVLTKEERHRFCCAKQAALAANPSLVGKTGKACKRSLCEAILKADPTMKPIMDKLKKHWMETHGKTGSTSAASPTASPATQE